MNRLFYKSEIYALKNSTRKQKNIYTYHAEGDVDKKKIQDLNNLYGAVLGIERKMKRSIQEKTLE